MRPIIICDMSQTYNPVHVTPVYKLPSRVLEAIFGPNLVAHVKPGKWVKLNNIKYPIEPDLLSQYTRKRIMKKMKKNE